MIGRKQTTWTHAIAVFVLMLLMSGAIAIYWGFGPAVIAFLVMMVLAALVS